MPRLMDELYIILVGIAFGFGAQTLLDSFSYDLFLRFLTLCAILLIWLHSQLAVGELEAYKIGRSWRVILAEHYLDTGSAILLVCASLLLGNQIAFYWLITISFLIDDIVEIMFLYRIQGYKEKYSRERELSRTWITINSVTIGLTVIVFWINRINPDTAMLAIIFLGNIFDYWNGQDFYFGLERKGKKTLMYDNAFYRWTY
jgi:hypothetical protein